MPTTTKRATKTSTQKRIPVAFCFDENMWMLGGVAIASLLYNARGAMYDIYCVVPEYFPAARRAELTRMVDTWNCGAKITFLDANHDFDTSVTHQYTVGIYYRFMLAKMLPASVDKIIYSDVDVAFCDSLDALYAIDMGKNIIAGVRDAGQGRPYPSTPNGYINSGVLVMNIAEIRRSGLYDTWLKLSHDPQFRYPDQDILNKTCDGRILYLGPKYNYMPGSGGRFGPAIAAGIYTADEVTDAHRDPTIIHYILRQPWRGLANLCGNQWWRYAAMTPFYAAFRAALETAPDRTVREILLFNAIPILKIKYTPDNVKALLFGVIPLYRVRRRVHVYPR